MISKAVSKVSRLDLLVNNAGSPGVKVSIPAARLDLMTEELWPFLFQVIDECVPMQQGCSASLERIKRSDRKRGIDRWFRLSQQHNRVRCSESRSDKPY